ncbi:unnamed protein product [Darwinula stevensoni]|uniref:Reelin n=1 Tax=Darwinula stevensoni TaxID=69355 RepID=A0A7R9A294_9CRUS|nr:unnamed protein product [Darwinula stevensoni]CAG0879040.1 unnamed protein product [Darwinula stevensoni]
MQVFDAQCHVHRCDEGYSGEDCGKRRGEEEGAQVIRMESEEELKERRVRVTGGGIGRGCARITSGNSLYFSRIAARRSGWVVRLRSAAHETQLLRCIVVGVRMMETKDFVAEYVQFLQFWLRIGGGDLILCSSTSSSPPVILEYSTDGGIRWHFLQEFPPRQHHSPRLVRIQAKGPVPGTGLDGWENGMPWMSTTDRVLKRYCNSPVESAVFHGSRHEEKFALTHDVVFRDHDVLMFEMAVECGAMFSEEEKVSFEYGIVDDRGLVEWSLFRNALHPPSSSSFSSPVPFVEPSIFYPGNWSRVLLTPPKRILDRPVLIRWIQKKGSGFSLRHVYLGPACPNHCSGHGRCRNGLCLCDSEKYLGVECRFSERVQTGLEEHFEDHDDDDKSGRGHVNGLIYHGGWVDFFCGRKSWNERSLVMGGPGPRVVLTPPLNTSNTSSMMLTVGIGSSVSSDPKAGCFPAWDEKGSVIVDASVDGGLTWSPPLQVLSPAHFQEPRPIWIPLPDSARGPEIHFRFWQPFPSDTDSSRPHPRPTWSVDDIYIVPNEPGMTGLEEDFQPLHKAQWFRISNGKISQTCGAPDNVLQFGQENSTLNSTSRHVHVAESPD